MQQVQSQQQQQMQQMQSQQLQQQQQQALLLKRQQEEREYLQHVAKQQSAMLQAQQAQQQRSMHPHMSPQQPFIPPPVPGMSQAPPLPSVSSQVFDPLFAPNTQPLPFPFAQFPSLPAAAAPAQLHIARDFPSFHVNSTSPFIATVYIRSENFDPLLQWFPWIEWDGNWLESFPLQTHFRVRNQRLEETIQALVKRGFRMQQGRLAARM